MEEVAFRPVERRLAAYLLAAPDHLLATQSRDSRGRGHRPRGGFPPFEAQ
jgi:hypothetical protein